MNKKTYLKLKDAQESLHDLVSNASSDEYYRMEITVKKMDKAMKAVEKEYESMNDEN